MLVVTTLITRATVVGLLLYEVFVEGEADREKRPLDGLGVLQLKSPPAVRCIGPPCWILRGEAGISLGPLSGVQHLDGARR